MSAPTIGSLVSLLEGLYPPARAEDWDRVGLVIGARSAEVRRVLYTVDVTWAVVEQARRRDAQLIIAHHPLLLRGIHAVDLDHPKGRLVAQLITSGIGLYVAHTNADVPTGGTVDALAHTLGLQDCRPLVPAPAERLDKIITFVPNDHAQQLTDALAVAGAGAVGDYDRCAFLTEGTGTFRPLEGSDPYLGRTGQVERVSETRIEMVLDRSRRDAVVSALLAAHPYETPAYDVLELAAVAGDAGLGRVGTLPVPRSLRDFAATVAAALPPTAVGARVSGVADQEISVVAVQAGAGDDLLDVARSSGADVYVTSDLRHHPASEAREWSPAPALIDIPHWAAEWTWLPVVRTLVDDGLAATGHRVESVISEICTDPWDFVIR
ncbi:Nif3-like dinuclear metal center hexameric protein [Microlunatus panaciterrae]|uniref:GTP cyclohydrolase 1 type 2 homolog n=1 Tax=Microlunatus panaciterrae TaxID=400768 RepID=A0ABS2RLL3_9ACTN|nr:Nif3-like dinuclear metal center hexameric protein [Microlunatus panaciterrae]MBM7799899.1 dinuclear metal center YbgI/SA1388 family protein [Microlunatus panaciterrae]